MKYLIKEDRLINLIDTYLEDTVGRLRVLTYPGTLRKGYFRLVDSNDNTIFRYHDYELGLHEELFTKMLALFNLNAKELSKIIIEWFNSHFPANLVLTIYPIIE